MPTEEIKKATDELMRELQKGEESAKENGYIDISKVKTILRHVIFTHIVYQIKMRHLWYTKC